MPPSLLDVVWKNIVDVKYNTNPNLFCYIEIGASFFLEGVLWESNSVFGLPDGPMRSYLNLTQNLAWTGASPSQFSCLPRKRFLEDGLVPRKIVWRHHSPGHGHMTNQHTAIQTDCKSAKIGFNNWKIGDINKIIFCEDQWFGTQASSFSFDLYIPYPMRLTLQLLRSGWMRKTWN